MNLPPYPKSESPRFLWSVMLWWFIASALGGIVGFYLCDLLSVSLINRLNIQNDLSFYITGAIIYTGFGTTIGIFQWIVIRRYLKDARHWILATFTGWLIGCAAGLIPTSNPDISMVGFAIVGTSVGIVQMLILRWQYAYAGWWILVNVLAWPAGLRIAELIHLPPAVTELQGLAISFGIIGGISGLICGLSFSILLTISIDASARNLPK